MGDMKDKFKGLMKKVNNQLNSSDKFKGQGRVLGGSSSSSRPVNPTTGPSTSGSQFVNPNRNPNPNPNLNRNPQTVSRTPLNPKPLISQKLPSSSFDPPVDKPSFDATKTSDQAPDSNPNVPHSDWFNPYGSLITSGNRNKNGYSLNVFECPVCNCGFTSEEEVSLHIESCIGNPFKKDVDDVINLGPVDDTKNEAEVENQLEVCVGTYLSGNPAEGSVETILRLLRNILKEPGNAKFRRIRMGNPKIREAIGEVAGGIDLLESVGFKLKEEEGEMWAVMDSPSEENAVTLKETIRLLESRKNVKVLSSTLSTEVAEKVDGDKGKPCEPEVIDRQIKVFFSVSESVAAKIELPDSFYNRSAEELRREAEMRRKKMADSQLLIPKSFREKQAQAARKRYTRSIIRIQFPDGVVLQGVFSPKEPTSSLYEFVCSALKQQRLEFELIHPVPVKRRVLPCFPMAGERAPTLEEEDLVPSALIKFKPIETDSIVFTGLTNELLEISEPLGCSSMS